MVRKWSGTGSEPQDDGIKKSIAVPAKDGWDAILEQINRHSFSLSAMAFQDVWNLDLNRVKDCCIHVVNPQGQLIPFCMYNLTDKNGNAIYRQQ